MKVLFPAMCVCRITGESFLLYSRYSSQNWLYWYGLRPDPPSATAPVYSVQSSSRVTPARRSSRWTQQKSIGARVAGSLRPTWVNSRASTSPSLSFSASSQESPASSARFKYLPTVPWLIPTDRSISRSVSLRTCFNRRTSRTFRIEWRSNVRPLAPRGPSRGSFRHDHPCVPAPTGAPRGQPATRPPSWPPHRPQRYRPVNLARTPGPYAGTRSSEIGCPSHLEPLHPEVAGTAAPVPSERLPQCCRNGCPDRAGIRTWTLRPPWPLIRAAAHLRARRFAEGRRTHLGPGAIPTRGHGRGVRVLCQHGGGGGSAGRRSSSARAVASVIAATARIDPATPAADLVPREVPEDHPKARSEARHRALLRALQLLVALAFFARAQVHPPDDPSALRFWLVARFRTLGQLALLTRPGFSPPLKNRVRRSPRVVLGAWAPTTTSTSAAARSLLRRHAVIADLADYETAAFVGELAGRCASKQLFLRTFRLPGGSERSFTSRTLWSWWSAYKKGGLEGLMPRCRADSGCPRAISPVGLAAASECRREIPTRSTKTIIDVLVKKGLVAGEAAPPLHPRSSSRRGRPGRAAGRSRRSASSASSR